MTTDSFDKSSIVSLFFEELNEHISIIHEQLHTTLDKEIIYRSVHSIKGGLNLLGFTELAPLFAAYEKLVMQEDDIAHISPLLVYLEELVLNLASDGEEEFLEKTRGRQEDINILLSKVDKLIDPTKLTAPVSPKNQEVVFDENLFTLFQSELESQIPELTDYLIYIEKKPYDKETFDALMRISHSIKGSTKVLKLDLITALAHSMETIFKGDREIQTPIVDLLLTAVDYLQALADTSFKELTVWLQTYQKSIESLTADITSGNVQASKGTLLAPVPKTKHRSTIAEDIQNQERTLRVTARHLDHLMGLAGESLVGSDWLEPFSKSLISIKERQDEIEKEIENTREALRKDSSKDSISNLLANLMHKSSHLKIELSAKLNELELFCRKNSSLSDRLYQEVINIRMRPFNDGIEGLPRMCRDLSNELGKKVQLNIVGKNTPVDREILEKLESPLNHIIRNAVDHGIETEEERVNKGKPKEGTITISAKHRGGLLEITIEDDGRGVDCKALKELLIKKGTITDSDIPDEELIQYLFMPNLTTKDKVTENSGRGFGLDVAKEVVSGVGGLIHLTSTPGEGLTVKMQLPLTLSLLRALIVEIGNEPYAIPLTRVGKTTKIRKEDLNYTEGRLHFYHEGRYIGLVKARDILELSEGDALEAPFFVVIIQNYAIIVDKYLGEKELVVQELDPNLGKVQNILAGAFLEDGSPLLIIDVENFVKSIDLYLYKEKVEL